ncbi:MAG TPA: O-antigen ligase family protein [Lacunisphaera sp.]|nr:O-antigen ligase family protein [Lacunisphaera sp.]
MTSAPSDPLRWPVRILAWAGAAGLAVLTLMDRGATRMFATPWTAVLAGTLAVPPLLLLCRLIPGGRPVRLPSAAWLIAAGAAGLVPGLSALASPHQGPSLLCAALPGAAACLFLWLHDALAADDARARPRVESALAIGAALCALTSTARWGASFATATDMDLWSAAVFYGRNSHPLGHANYTAGLMLLGLPWLARAAWQARGMLRVAAWTATALALLNLFMSGSRGGLLGLAALGVTAVAVAGLGWKRFSLLAAGAVLLAGVLALANPRVRSLLGPADPGAAPSASAVQRAAMLRGGLLMGRDRPVLGWGPGTTPLVYPRYRAALEGGVENALQLHNTPVQLWAETGVAGLLGVALLGALAALNWRRSRVAAATFSGYAVFALTDYQLDIPVFAAAMATLGALLAPPQPGVARFPPKLGVGVATVAAATVIVLLGARDRAPWLNVDALQRARHSANHASARALLEKSLALNPDQEIAHFNLGWLLAVPDPPRAEQHFLQAAHLVPDKGGVYFGLGLARLNQGRTADAARAFALECVNDPRFLASPWWTVPEIAAQRVATAHAYTALLDQARLALPEGTWTAKQTRLLQSLAPRLGEVSPGPEASYRRERIGYPVLMRNLDLEPPRDLYDVREDPRFPTSVPFPLPGKGWLPTPILLKLLDEPSPTRH